MAETRVVITADAGQALTEFQRLRAEASGALNQMGQGSTQLNRVGASAAQTAAALRQVPAQFTDIVVSLQAGQNPLTVLLQQGGQLRDMFGSSGAAARALGGYVIGLINPYTVLIAAVAAVAVAYNQGSKEADAYNKAIVMSGNAAGTSKDQLADMAREIGKGSNTQGAAAEALAALVETGKVANDNLQAFAVTALNTQKRVGIAVADTAKTFQDLGDSPLQATVRLNEKYNYLTAAVYEQIKALEQRGDKDAAGEVAQKAYVAAMDQRTAAIKSNLGSLESAWEWVATKSKKAWDAMLDIGRGDTLTEKIAAVQKKIQAINLEQMSFVGSSKENKAESNLRKKALQEQLQGLQDTQQAEQKANVEKAAANNLEQARIKWLQDGDQYLTRQQQLENALTKARVEGAAAGKSQEEIDTRIGKIRQSYSDIANDSINAQIEAIHRRAAVEDEVSQRSMNLLASRYSVGLVRQEDYIRAVAKLDDAAFEKQKSRLAAELALTAKKLNTQKDQAALRGQIDEAAAKQATRAAQAENQLAELEVRNTRTAADNYANVIEKQQDSTKQIADQLLAQRDYNAAIGLTKTGLVALAASRLEDRARIADQNAEIAEGLDFSGRMSDEYRKQAQELRDLAAAQREGAAKDAVSAKFSPQDLEKFLDPAAAKSFGDTLKDAFGGAGDALTKLRTSLEDYGIEQQTIERARAAAAVAYAGDSNKLAAANATIDKKAVLSRVGAYADMASAAKSFFNENSKGYKVLQAAEKAFRVYELALSAQSTVQKLLGINTVTAATVTGEVVKSEAVAAGTAEQLAADAIKGTSAAAVGVAVQAEGDPYSAFARMAAMAAAMAALGFTVFGGGEGSSVSLSQQRQESQGTGTVFGDAAAKSNSIARSLELMSNNSDIELSYTRGMLNSLRSIESSLTGLGNLLIRTSGLTGTAASTVESSAQTLFESVQAPWSIAAKPVGKLVGSIFGGKTTVEDTGFTLDPTTLAAAIAGNVNSFQYADIKKEGGWFSSDKWRTDKTALGDEADAQFAKVIANIGSSVTEAAKLLGVGGDEFTARLNGFVVDIGKISLKDLSADEIQEQIEAVFSKLSDDMAQFAVGGLEQFQQVGEGYFETLTRLASDYANLDSILASSGVAFGQTGVASIAARERLIELAGGIDDLASSQSSFNENFLTKAEQLAPVQKYVTDQLAAMGLQSLDTRDKFKEYVLGLASSGALLTETGAQQYAALLALADAFAETHAATVDLTKTEQEIADERTDLLQQLDELTKSEAELLEAQRAGIDDANKALFDQVGAAKAVSTAKDALAKAYETEAAAAKTVIDKTKAWVTTLQSLNNSLALSDQSILTPEQQYAEARRQFEDTLAKANAGDSTAQGQLSAAEQAFLKASKAINASDSNYAADYARVVAANEEAAKWAAEQVDVQQASLDALEAQVKGLVTINDSVLTVAQGIADLNAAMAAATGLGVTFTNAPVVTVAATQSSELDATVDYSRYTTAAVSAGSDALVTEIRSLREQVSRLNDEVEQLRKDGDDHTGALLEGMAQASSSNAEAVVSGMKSASKTAAWQKQNQKDATT